jgi:D-alanyl-lipoteichoic acid acyltransferase DltB (MBOAT superfamily)
MDSASFQLVLFGLVAALFSNFSRSRLWRSIVLMLASVGFLGLLTRNLIFLLPLIGFVLLGYTSIALIRRGPSTSTACSILTVVLIYVWLKKYTFLPAGVFLHFPYFTLGLSYIFFRVLHLLIETGDGREKRGIGLAAYLLYMLNFTTFVAGPIQHYDEFAEDQFASEPIDLGPHVIGLQLGRIACGFFKVNVLAMLFHAIQEDALAQVLQPLPLTSKLEAAFRLTVVYPFFLYSNFSGYIDIVIGLARLMRLRLPENFDRPFSASSVLDFWNRWHMTLSSWLKAYVYNPLLMALMRRISSLTLQPFLGVFCFFVTFFLIGVWHGRTSEFVIFGILTGAGMSTNKAWQLGLIRVMGRRGYKELANTFVYVAFCRGLNFTWFSFTLYWFWADWRQIDRISAAFSAADWLGVWTTTWLFATAVLALWEWLRATLLSFKVSEEPLLTSRYARVVYATALGLVAFVTTILLNQPAPGIVYKAF